MSAQNHSDMTDLAWDAPSANTRSRTAGRANAAPTSSAASIAKPATRPDPNIAKSPAPINNAAANPVCHMRPAPACIAHARGRADVSSGMRANCHKDAAAARPVPPKAIAKPDSHHSGRS